MSSREHKDKIWNYIKDIGTCMLVTEDGKDLRARPMHLVQDEYDGRIWFFTERSAAKSYEVIQEQNVCLTFCDHDNNVHVSLSGVAKISRDKNLIDKFWNGFVSAWFPAGKDDPDVVLLEIKINKGEHWDSKSNKIIQLYEITKAKISGEKPDLGENKKFG